MTNNSMTTITIDDSALVLPPKREGLHIADDGGVRLTEGATKAQRRKAMVLGTRAMTDRVQDVLRASIQGLGGQPDNALLRRCSYRVMSEWDNAPVFLDEADLPRLDPHELRVRQRKAVERAQQRAAEKGVDFDVRDEAKAVARAEASAMRQLAEVRSAIDRQHTMALALMLAKQADAVLAGIEAERKEARDTREPLTKARKKELKAQFKAAEAAKAQAGEVSAAA